MIVAWTSKSMCQEEEYVRKVNWVKLRGVFTIMCKSRFSSQPSQKLLLCDNTCITLVNCKATIFRWFMLEQTSQCAKKNTNIKMDHTQWWHGILSVVDASGKAGCLCPQPKKLNEWDCLGIMLNAYYVYDLLSILEPLGYQNILVTMIQRICIHFTSLPSWSNQ